MAEHTPGPWEIDKSNSRTHIFQQGEDVEICVIMHVRQPGNSVDWRETLAMEANARLIAAAPETAAERDRLRHELEGLRQWVRDGYAKKSVLERFDAALATAKQKEPADGP